MILKLDMNWSVHVSLEIYILMIILTEIMFVVFVFLSFVSDSEVN